MPRSIAAGAIAFIGFGEAALAFLDGWRTAPDFAARVSAYDVKTDSPDPAVRAGKRARLCRGQCDRRVDRARGRCGRRCDLLGRHRRSGARGCCAALPGVERGAFFDCDSCAPQTKERTAKEVDAAGGRYVDVAVMAPVHPRLHRTPLLISGPHAKDAAPVLAALGMAADIHEGPVGSSSAIKMIRSIMMKGLEALVCECVLAGMKAGVIETVLDSLDDAYPGFDWRRRSAYMLERVLTDGVRRAAEMREVALTVASTAPCRALGSAGSRRSETSTCARAPRRPRITARWRTGFSRASSRSAAAERSGLCALPHPPWSR